MICDSFFLFQVLLSMFTVSVVTILLTFKSLWTMFLLCKYSTAVNNCFINILKIETESYLPNIQISL